MVLAVYISLFYVLFAFVFTQCSGPEKTPIIPIVANLPEPPRFLLVCGITMRRIVALFIRAR